MTHELRGYVDPAVDIDMVGRSLGIEAWVEPVIMPDRTTPPTIREVIDGTEYLFARYHLSDQADATRVLRKLGEGIGRHVQWGVVQHRRSAAEYRNRQYESDQQYYRPSLTTGLRSGVRLEKTGHLTARLSPVAYIVNGTEHDTDGQELTFNGHDTGQRKEWVVADGTGVRVTDNPGADAVELAEVSLYPSEIEAITTRTQAEQYGAGSWTTEYEIGTVPESVRNLV